MSEARGRLVFVGLGLDDERGLTLRGLEEARAADVVFAEFYTSALRQGSVERLGKVLGKDIRVLDRRQVEDAKTILDACVGNRVVLLVAGDPMTATTHVDLRIRAHMAGIETSVVHGPSVFTSVAGLLGLQHYKFGRTTTLPFPQEGFAPTSPYEVVCENNGRGLHTLVLLDIDADSSRYMTANEGLRLLLDMERRASKGVVTMDTVVGVVARAGSEDAVVMAGPVSRLLDAEFGPPLHSIVVPGKLHFMEEEALRAFAGLK
ncbi:MAG: diphthine synthase [Thermoplasmata archaeon]